MKITSQLTDEGVLQALGERLSNARIEKNLTQAALAEQAGVAKRTVERLESGAVAVQFSGFLRVCRALGLLEQFDMLIPEAAASPMAQLKLQGRKRQRAAGKKVAPAVAKKWTWGELLQNLHQFKSRGKSRFRTFAETCACLIATTGGGAR